jgi:hypothetical protein
MSSLLLKDEETSKPRRRAGRQPYPVELRHITVAVTAAQREAIEQLSDEQRISLSEATRQILARALGTEPTP